MDLVRSLQHGKKKQSGKDGRQIEKNAPRQDRPRLERRNASKNIDYEAVDSLDSVGRGVSDGRGFRSRSLEISPASSSASPPPSVYFASQISFRIDGEVEGEVDSLFRNLGIDPDDFAITPADLEAAGMVSSPAVRNGGEDRSLRPSEEEPPHHQQEEIPRIAVPERSIPIARVSESQFSPQNAISGGIKGPRPPMLVPPPAISLPSHDQNTSTWELIRSLAPAAGANGGAFNGPSTEPSDSEEEDADDGDELSEDSVREEENELRPPADLSGSCSTSTSTAGDSPSATADGTIFISRNAKLKRPMISWKQGERLGSGSFGTVFEAMSDDGFFFAIKEVSLLDQGANAQQCIFQLEQEIALLSQFEHENIVQYYGTDKAEANLYIFLELVTKGSLSNLFQKYGRLGDSQASVYTRQILSGLQYLHERGVVHRDIKCANILVHHDASVKLADFGLAKQTSKINELKSCKGSVYWMAPEVVRPKGSYGAPADIWSLGCTVLEMLTGQVPYPNQEWTQVMFHVGRGGQPEIPASLSRDARDFIQQCVQRKPEERPTAAELLQHPFILRSYRASSGSDSSSHGRSRRPHTPRLPH